MLILTCEQQNIYTVDLTSINQIFDEMISRSLAFLNKHLMEIMKYVHLFKGI